MVFTALVAEASDLTAPSFQFATLDLDTTYFWRVSATNILGVSDWSDV